METKICTKCKKIKSITEFCKHKLGKYGRNWICRECKRIISLKYYYDNIDKCKKEKLKYYYTNRLKILKQSNKYYKKNRELILKKCKKYREKIRDKISRERKEKSKWFSEYKLNNSCQFCGYNRCVAALEFHHLDPNKKDMIGSMGAYSLKRIKREMKDCILLCANCHKELHANDYKRNNGGMFQ